jgi:hypothetical protein
MSNQTEILEKIRKLLNLAKDVAATPSEAEAAIGRATHLMGLHGITDDAIQSHLRMSDTPNEIRIDDSAIVREFILETGRIGRWDCWVAQAACLASNTKYYLTKGHGIVGYGLPVDLAVTRELFKYIFEVGERLRNIYCALNMIRYGSQQGKAWMDGFCHGVIEAAKKIALETKADTKTEVKTNTGALVLVSDRSLAIARSNAIALYAKKNLNLHYTSGYSARGGNAYYDGKAVGTNQKLGRNSIQ